MRFYCLDDLTPNHKSIKINFVHLMDKVKTKGEKMKEQMLADKLHSLICKKKHIPGAMINEEDFADPECNWFFENGREEPWVEKEHLYWLMFVRDLTKPPESVENLEQVLVRLNDILGELFKLSENKKIKELLKQIINVFIDLL